MTIARVLRSLPRFGGRVLLAASLFGMQQVAAQTCQPDKLYDIISGAFHHSVAQRTDGTWAGWGQGMANGGNALSPQDLSSANYPGMTGTPLLTSTGGSQQAVLLTTDGLWVWGTRGHVVDNVLASVNQTSIQKVNPTGTAANKSMPSGVAPADVATMLANNYLLTISTKSDKGGHVYVLAASSSPGASMYGDGSATRNDAWHQVKTGAGANDWLTGVTAVRGHVGGTNSGAMMALTASGDAYTWGRSARLGDSTAATTIAYATKMTLPHQVAPTPLTNSTPKMIGVTGNGNSNDSTYFVLYANGELFSMGSNSVNQLGDNTLGTGANTNVWGAVKRPDGTAFNDVDFISVQEHYSAYASAVLITKGQDLYNWGNNNYNMLGRPTNTSGCTGSGNSSVCTMGQPTNFVNHDQPNPTLARYVEMGGHTMVFLRERSSKFCYVGHKTNGSMGDGSTDNVAFPVFTCDATPNLNICGMTGFDYGDAPFVYENGGGSKLALHFYQDLDTEGKLFLGDLPPQAGDASPKSVVLGTSNVGENGDYIAGSPAILEEDGVGIDGGILANISTADTTFTLTVKYTNDTSYAANVYAWVDWDNDNKFSMGERAQAATTINTTGGTVSLTWNSSNGMQNLTEGRRYIRIRITTNNLGNTDDNGSDAGALGFASDGEIEDHAVWVKDPAADPNLPPIAVDVTARPVAVGTSLVKLELPGGAGDAKLDGYDQAQASKPNAKVVSYRITSLPSNGTLGYMVGLTFVPLAVGQAIEAGVPLYYEGGTSDPTSFMYKAIDDDGDESSERAGSNPGTPAAGDAIFTIPKAQIAAQNDTASTAVNVAVNTPVTGNDSAQLFGPDTPQSVTITTLAPSAAHGTVACTNAPTPSCQYTPTNGYVGSDSYTYTICMEAPNAHLCSTATVNVTVSALTIAPVSDVTNTPPGVQVGIPVLQNDRGDAPLDPASITVTTPPTKGNVNCVAGVCTYEPSVGQTGVDTFTYRVCLAAPNDAVCDTATVTVNIGAAGVVATDDVTNTPLNTPKTIPVTQNDTATGGTIEPTSVVKTSDPTHGSVSCANGQCVYTPDAGYAGTDTFTYKVCLAAPDAAVCDEAQVTVNVGTIGLTATNDVTNTPPGTPKTVPVRQNDTATGGGTIDPGNVVATSGPTNGTVDCTSGECVYTPNGGFTGTDQFTYKVCLAAPNATVCDEAQVTVNVGTTGVVATDDVTNTQPNTAETIPVVQNDTATGGGTIDPNSVVKTSDPANGTVICTNGECVYTPNGGFTGTDQFTYKVCLAAPNATVCDEALVTVNVGTIGLTATDDVTNTQPGTPKTVPVRQNDTATGGGTIDPASVAKTSDPANGTVTCAAGECVYTPNGGFTGADQFTYKVCLAAPNATVCDEALVTVNVGTAGVTATDDVTNTPPGTPKAVPVVQNDTATGSGTIDPASVAKTSDPANGTVTCAAGECVYTPNGGFTGTDQFTYKVCLAAPNATVCDEALVTVAVSTAGGPVLDASDDTANTTTGTGVNVPVTTNDSVTGGGLINPASVVSTSGPANGTVDCVTTPGVCRYTPNAGFTGGDSFTYRVCLQAPNQAICDEAVVRVQVAAAPAPGNPAGIPTLNEWGLIILSALMVWMGLARRRQV